MGAKKEEGPLSLASLRRLVSPAPYTYHLSKPYCLHFIDWPRISEEEKEKKTTILGTKEIETV